jgi:hypothetical protein
MGLLDSSHRLHDLDREHDNFYARILRAEDFAA